MCFFDEICPYIQTYEAQHMMILLATLFNVGTGIRFVWTQLIVVEFVSGILEAFLLHLHKVFLVIILLGGDDHMLVAR